MSQPSDKSTSGRWTIYVCPDCGRAALHRDYVAGGHVGEVAFTRCTGEGVPVEVVAVDALLSDEAVGDACATMHDRLPHGCSMSIARAGLTAAVAALTGKEGP